jgi:uncharacterized protein
VERFVFDVGAVGATSAVVYRAAAPRKVTLVLAHGAGAPQTHPFMVDMATRLAARGVDVVTFDFPYAANGRRMPDPVAVLEATWRAAIASVRARTGLPTAKVFAGGKSMGGRILSQIVAAGDRMGLRGLVFLGYPLHPVGKPKVRRDAHLPSVSLPMLFVQGSRDALGDAKEMRALVKTLPGSRLYLVRGGDHSFAMLKSQSSPASQAEAVDAVADAIVAFVSGGSRKGGVL